MSNQDCLSEQDLRAFLLGELPDGAVGRVVAHLEACPACEAAAASLDRMSDPILESLRQAVRATSRLALATPERRPPPRVTPRDGAADKPSLVHYEMLEELGRGGMGVVYRARDRRLGRVVALKVVKAGADAEPEVRARFQREAAAMACLQHPRIVQIFEVGEQDGVPFLALEFVDGSSLAQRLQGAPLPARQAAELLEGLARAMAYAHQRGVLHRDLKPANVLVAADGTVKITDFGLARLLSGGVAMTQTGAIMGTPSYLSPEQADGKSRATGPAADVYALGAILYELLTGRPPFRAATVLETLAQVVHDEPVSPRQLLPQTPLDLDTICLKCLQKEPGQRYPTAQALADDLSCFLAGKAIQARPVGLAERGWRWCRRNPVVAGLVVAVLATLLLGIGVTTALAFHANRKAGDADREARNALDTAKREKEAKEEALQAQARATAAEKRKDEQLLWSEGLVYAGRLREALVQWEAGNVTAAWEHLDSCRWDLRGWEHRYLCTLFQRNQVTLRGHKDQVYCAIFSPDGTRIASGGRDGSLKVWDAGAGQELLSFQGHSGQVVGLAFSPDSRQLASCGTDKLVRLWNVRTGQEVLSLKGHTDQVVTVAFHPDGSRLVSSSGDGKVKVWDVRTGRELLTFKGHTRSVQSAVFSPDGTRIASGGQDRKVLVWDAGTGRELLSFEVQTGGIFSLAFSPDGSRIASSGAEVGGGNSAVRVWDSRGGQQLLSIPLGLSYAMRLAFSPDGLRIAGSSWSSLPKVWDARSGQELLALKGHLGFVNSVAFSPDGLRLVSGGNDATVKVWDVRGEQEVWSRGKDHGMADPVAFSPNGSSIAAGSRKGPITIWDARGGQELLSLKGHRTYIKSLAFSGDGLRLISSSNDKSLRVWDVQRGQEIFSVKEDGPVDCVVFSSDGSRIAGADKARKILTVRDAQTGQQLFSLKTSIRSIVFSPDGSRILSGGDDAVVRVWDTHSGDELLGLKGHLGPITCLAFSADGSRIASGSADNTVKVWDSQTGKELLSLTGHTKLVSGVAFSLDGSRIFSAGWDQTLKVWDARRGQETLTLPAGNVISMALSPDGLRLITNGDPTPRMWDMRVGREVGFLTSLSWPVSVAFSPDGGRLVSGGGRTVQVWNLHTGQALLSLLGPTDKVISVGFSTDGRRVLGKTEDGKILAWDISTQQLLPEADEPPPPPTRQATSPDGRLQILTDQTSIIKVVRVREQAEAERQQQAWNRETLERLARFDPDYHLAQAAAAEQAGEPFAASFHLARLLRAWPWDAQLHLRQAHALARQHRATEAATHLSHALFLHPRISLWPHNPSSPVR